MTDKPKQRRAQASRELAEALYESAEAQVEHHLKMFGFDCENADGVDELQVVYDGTKFVAGDDDSCN